MPPRKRKTPMHCFPVTDEDWAAAKAATELRGENFSEELRKAVRRIAKRKPRPPVYM